MKQELRSFLDSKAELYNESSFVDKDPILIPRSFQKKQDIEIMGLWTAILSWGLRKTIINKAKELVELMDGVPHDFMVHHSEKERKRFLNFKHRTFQPIDTLYFLEFFQNYYKNNESLETAFSQHLSPEDETVEKALIGFHNQFFSLQYAPQRTRKHVSTPVRKSTCKRLNMFLRWMVRQDKKGVDFGIWQQIKPSQLLMPLDVHVDRIARMFGLIQRKQTDWLTVLELTKELQKFDPEDPVKYDYALFGLGVIEKYHLLK